MDTMENFPQFLAPKEIQLNDNNSVNADENDVNQSSWLTRSVARWKRF